MKIGFFGRLRNVLGDELDLAVEVEGETVAGLRRRLAGLHPQAAGDLLSPRIRACVADSIVGDDFVVGGQERVEFFPPYSGG